MAKKDLVVAVRKIIAPKKLIIYYCKVCKGEIFDTGCLWNCTEAFKENRRKKDVHKVVYIRKDK